MSAILLEDAVIDRLRRRLPRYHESVYGFVLASLQFAIERLDEPRHVTGRELAEGFRDLALDRWGPMASCVLECWGISCTGDLGEIVFGLVDCGVLVKQDDDLPGDFADVFDFEDVFVRNYPWSIANVLRPAARV
jgi:uncharacterized repeat protein (TIGR04138 family)